MRKILALAVTLALLPALFACGRAEDEPTSETTTKTASTTETETTTEAEVTRDCPWGQDEIAVLDTITLFYKVSPRWAPCCDIWMRDNATGEETLLLAAYEDEQRGRMIPGFCGEISERYFLYEYGILDSDVFSAAKIFDIAKMRTIELAPPPDLFSFGSLSLKEVKDGKVYMNEYIEGIDDPAVFYFALSALDGGGPVALKALGQ